MRLYTTMIMTVNRNYVFFVLLLIVIVELTRFDLVIKQEETLPQELSAELLRSSPTLDKSALDEQIKNRFDKRVEVMKRACSVRVYICFVFLMTKIALL
jgi:hypothetical protein